MSGRFVVLVVDDERTIRDLVSWALTRGGYNVLSAKSGEDALAMLETRTVNLILMDVMMPYMDGFETAKRIRQDDLLKNIPIVFLTAVFDENIQAKCSRLGVKDFLSKPVDINRLIECVGRNT